MKFLTALAAFFLLLPAAARADDLVSADRIKAGEAFVDLLVAGDFPAAFAQFDSTMKAALPLEKLKAVWSGLPDHVGAFTGRMASRGEKSGPYDVVIVTCGFDKQMVDTRVVFDDSGRVSGLFFAPSSGTAGADWTTPSYVDQGSFQERDVTIGVDHWLLPGVLTIPSGKGPYPAVVLIHGSGPHERDETIGSNKPFKDLAWGLASRGVAVLRFDKRTKVYGQKLAGMKSLTVREETTDDARYALDAVRIQAGIDPNRVFVLGHSLGGMLIPRIAAADPKLAGAIVLAGAARPLDEVAVEQIAYVAGLATTSENDRKKLEQMTADLAKVKALDAAKLDSSEVIMGVPAAYWVDLRSLHPAEDAKALPMPLLILQGERDYQVTMADFGKWKEALRGRKDVTLTSYPDLNHLFITGSGKSVPSEYSKPGHMDLKVVDQIAAWVKSAPPRK